MPERPTTCRFGAPTQDGSRSSSMTKNRRSSGICLIRRFLMFQEEKMLKDKLLLYGVNMVSQIRDGEYSMLIRPNQFKIKDSILNGECTVIDHSISDPDFQ
jgi:hypothetical protein